MLAVTVIGNIGNDAEIKEFNGQKFIAFNVASTERYKDRQGNQHSRTTWVSCLKPGESSVVTYLKKGTQVYVRGSLSVKTFNSGNGVQAGVNCLVRELQLLVAVSRKHKTSSNSQLLPARRQSIPRREVLRRFHRKTKKMIFLFKNIQLTEK
ncbi:single-stranded DNA-binding protein [Bacteroides stercoris]|uniref:single-stranded DNA-binding protein n=1 Tax=Bacteroides stercoris TaxID=46506 RepID=UPI0018A02DFA|nr:single-stranded DNA-binding protein [Bacteroides stercoris]MDC2298771.1 single-stranded DNA-binding protein [Bacteroides stercoris]MDC2305799.1 single-stranded DNA-binding protein [Bacteroides stercoris]